MYLVFFFFKCWITLLLLLFFKVIIDYPNQFLLSLKRIGVRNFFFFFLLIATDVFMNS